MRWRDLLCIPCLAACHAFGGNGLPRVALRPALSPLGLTVVEASDQHIAFRGTAGAATFQKDSRKILLNGSLVWLNAPTQCDAGQWTLSQADVQTTLLPMLAPRSALERVRCAVVVLDPGHGGRDTGAISPRRVYEKRVVLDIAKRVQRALRGSGLKVKSTRWWDSTLGLADRTARTRAAGADVMVSVHANSAGNTNAAGVETYLLPAAGFPSTSGANSDTRPAAGNAFDAANAALAQAVHREALRATSSPDRGIKRARYDVLRNAPCPAVLVECGFLSSPKDEANLIRRSYREGLAQGIARGILAYRAAAGQAPEARPASGTNVPPQRAPARAPSSGGLPGRGP
jgi:N-acetylmuramoyl-L-alanine amidase